MSADAAPAHRPEGDLLGIPAWFWLLLLTTVWVCTRLGWTWTYPPEDTGDPAEYLRLAKNLRTHGVYGLGKFPEVFWPPLWPWMLSWGVPGIDALSLDGHRVLAFLVQLANFLALWKLGRMASERLLVPVTVGLLVILNPSHLLISNTLGTEHIFTLLGHCVLLGMLWGLRSQARQDGRWWTWVLASIFSGAALGLATLVRPVTLPLIALLPFVGWQVAIQRRSRLGICCLVVAAVAAVPVVFWTVRNHRVTGKWVVVASNGSQNLWYGNNALPDPGWIPRVSPVYQQFEGMDPLQRSALERHLALTYIKENPLDVAGKAPLKVAALFSGELYPRSFRWTWLRSAHPTVLSVMRGLNVTLHTAAMAGVVLYVAFTLIVPLGSALRKDAAWLFFLVIAGLTLTHVMTWGHPRYRYPFEALLWMFSVAGYAQAVAARRRCQRDAAAEPTS